LHQYHSDISPSLLSPPGRSMLNLQSASRSLRTAGLYSSDTSALLHLPYCGYVRKPQTQWSYCRVIQCKITSYPAASYSMPVTAPSGQDNFRGSSISKQIRSFYHAPSMPSLCRVTGQLRVEFCCNPRFLPPRYPSPGGRTLPPSAHQCG
jgi:hypothetical protein